MKRGLGFTLIEVMVALVVFSVVSVALVKNTTTSLRQSGMIEDRTIAWWLAENEMTSLRMLPRSDDSYPNSGTSREVVEINDGSWGVETTVEATENGYVRRIVISVYRENQEDSKARLIGFLGRY
jgi:general secretion pathway protein I